QDVARPRGADPGLAVEARHVPDVLLGREEEAVDTGGDHPAPDGVDPTPVLHGRKFPAGRRGWMLELPQASHPATPPCRPQDRMLRSPRHLIQPHGSFSVAPT